ncbi:MULTISPECIES: DNA ligase [unclassified Vibrio]|uniref:DNA ligase n=1 Tax=Vibrio sp. HB236076 TaxID=3232307 RepID=A0AB39HDK8_9VIBR|nr:DNA ligase [Vibrio sp. HB161653]MDP5253428.1 DNA ligase [Vibrio sp. HB161653]
MQKTVIALALLALWSSPSPGQANQESLLVATHFSMPPLALASTYQHGQELNWQDYWWSEKYDGVRGYWDGKQMRTRHGHIITLPPKWYADLPPWPVEGELWAGRNHFSTVQQTVFDHQPNLKAWRQIRFVLFDMPQRNTPFSQRYAELSAWFQHQSSSHLLLAAYQPVYDKKHLADTLDNITAAQGEGVMLRNWHNSYQPGRSHGFLKVKAYQDSEVTVIGYAEGKGRLKGKVGALITRTSSGLVLRVGSGLSDDLRQMPPEIGSVITIRHNGVTDNGLPRFARFWRYASREHQRVTTVIPP